MADQTITARTLRLFLSWSHKDRVLKTQLVDDRLIDELGILTGLKVEWWEDSHIHPGEDIQDQVAANIDEADMAVALLSRAYFSSAFIKAYELPRFTGAAAERGIMPVALRRILFDGSRDYRGVDKLRVFDLDGRAFSELRGNGRDEFGQELASEIRRRGLGLGGYRPL